MRWALRTVMLGDNADDAVVHEDRGARSPLPRGPLRVVVPVRAVPQRDLECSFSPVRDCSDRARNPLAVAKCAVFVLALFPEREPDGRALHHHVAITPELPEPLGVGRGLGLDPDHREVRHRVGPQVQASGGPGGWAAEVESDSDPSLDSVPNDMRRCQNGINPGPDTHSRPCALPRVSWRRSGRPERGPLAPRTSVLSLTGLAGDLHLLASNVARDEREPDLLSR